MTMVKMLVVEFVIMALEVVLMMIKMVIENTNCGYDDGV